ncbi:MAG: SRPBCC domain-containing protein [Deltaproteobacteria bacterium]|nr:SRPBCC domain-containing protein [Deltaproteobacteria bacterium]
MSESTKRAVFKVSIRGTVDAVWRELTRREGPQKAMFNAVLHTDGIAPGGTLRMRSINGKYTAVAGQYIEVEEPVRLTHTMRFTTNDDPECRITYRLEETAEGVDLTLTVDDLPVGSKSEKQLRQGGPFIVNNLKAIVETGKPTFGTRLLYVLFKVLEPLNPKRARSEHWPLPTD